MCFSDFRKLYTKIFVSIDFPPSFVGFRFYDKWTEEESGGLPINNTEQEFKSWANNPQYYINIKKSTVVFISLLQNDGRLTKSKFPFPEATRKACLIISKVQGKNSLEAFDDKKTFLISPVRQHRENSLYTILPKGEYVISCCILKQGEIGSFCLQIYLEDNLLEKNKNTLNFFDKMEFTYVERLNDKNKNVKCKIYLNFS